MSSALGVELIVSMINHPLRNGALAKENSLECDRSVLGILPQQMRGDLTTFEIKCLYGEAFNKCTGCSKEVGDAFLADKRDFLLRACNQPDYLEDLTGITKMNAEINYDDIESFGSDFGMSD